MYTDDYLRYDYKAHRYVLTLKYVTDVLGIDLERRVTSNGAVSGQAVINRVLNTASMHVYNYIYACNISPQCHQWIIANCKTAREIIQRAMGEQLAYILQVGDLSRSMAKEERQNYMDIQAKLILNETIEELGYPLTTLIPFTFTPPSYAEGQY